MNRRILILASDNPLARIIFHTLAHQYDDIHVLIEEKESAIRLLRRRLRSLGFFTVIGQVLFMILILPILRRTAGQRIRAIKREFGLDDSPIDAFAIRVSSVNSEEARSIIRQLDPRLIVVCGTRIIGKKTLASIHSPLINIHAGITPLYRGVHGGYWALVEGQAGLVGTTIHLVDRGIDSGDIVSQDFFGVSRCDSFVTYPYLHVVAALPALYRAVKQSLEGELEHVRNPLNLTSQLRSHPTLWTYLANRLLKGIR